MARIANGGGGGAEEEEEQDDGATISRRTKVSTMPAAEPGEEPPERTQTRTVSQTEVPVSETPSSPSPEPTSDPTTDQPPVDRRQPNRPPPTDRQPTPVDRRQPSRPPPTERLRSVRDRQPGPRDGDLIQRVERDLEQAAETHRQGRGLLPSPGQASRAGTEAGELGPFSPSPEFSRGVARPIGTLNPAAIALGFGKLAESGGETLFDVGRFHFASDPTERQEAAEELQRDVTIAGATGAFLASETARSFRERPIETFGTAATLGLGETGVAIAGGRAIERSATAARAARTSRTIDFEDVTDPATASGETRLPLFSEEAQRGSAARAAEEFRERMADTGSAFDEPTAFHGTRGDIGTASDFVTEAGEAELPGLFTSADLSPLRLPGGSAPGPSPSSGLGLRPPRIRAPSTVAAFPDLDIDTLGERTLREGREMLEERAGQPTGFVRSGTRTAEQEAIIPPGTGFTATGESFGIRFGSELVPGKSFVGQAADAPDAASARTARELAEAEDVTDISDVLRRSRRRQATEPALPTGIGFGATTTSRTSETTPTDVPSATDIISGPTDTAGPTSGPTSGPPSGPGPSAPPTSGPPTQPPTSGPPSSPPTSGPPTSGPPSGPPSGPGPSGGSPAGPIGLGFGEAPPPTRTEFDRAPQSREEDIDFVRGFEERQLIAPTGRVADLLGFGRKRKEKVGFVGDVTGGGPLFEGGEEIDFL